MTSSYQLVRGGFLLGCCCISADKAISDSLNRDLTIQTNVWQNLGPLLSNDASSSGETAVSPFADWSALINLIILANTIWMIGERRKYDRGDGSQAGKTKEGEGDKHFFFLPPPLPPPALRGLNRLYFEGEHAVWTPRCFPSNPLSILLYPPQFSQGNYGELAFLQRWLSRRRMAISSRLEFDYTRFGFFFLVTPVPRSFLFLTSNSQCWVVTKWSKIVLVSVVLRRIQTICKKTLTSYQVASSLRNPGLSGKP